MIATIINLVIEQGADFDESFQFLDDADTPLDFTDCSARMQIRKKIDDAEPLVLLATSGGQLAIDIATGTIAMHLDATVTAGLQSGGVYDLEVVYPSGAVHRMLKGTVKLDLEVTR